MPFISFDGGEGGGKSTQIRRLARTIRERFPNKKVMETREPGGTPLAEDIRSMIFEKMTQEADAKTQFGLFMAARYDHIHRAIVPAIGHGAVILTDRFVASTYAYQLVAAGNRSLQSLFDIHVETLDAFPDLTIIFDIDPMLGLARVRGRNEKLTHFDEQKLEFHLLVRAGFLEFAERYATNEHCFRIIDASRSMDDVFEELCKEIFPLLS